GLDQRQLDLEHALARLLGGVGGLQRRQGIGRRLGGRRRVGPFARRQGQRWIGRQQLAQQPRRAQQQEQQRQRQQQGAKPGDRRPCRAQDGQCRRRLEHGSAHWRPRHRLGQRRRQQRSGGVLLVAPADDHWLVADQEDEGRRGRAGGELQR